MLWVIVGAVVWCYFGLLGIRWDKHDFKVNPVPGCHPMPPAAFILWPLVLLGGRADNLPPSPWSVTEPTVVIPAEEYTLQMEKETGLEFDGIFLKPGYTDRGES